MSIPTMKIDRMVDADSGDASCAPGHPVRRTTLRAFVSAALPKVS